MGGPRLVAVIAVFFVLQISLFPEMRFVGVTPELPLLVSAFVGLHLGADRGIVVGFVIGLLYDIALGTPLGGWALVCCVAAYPLGAAAATLDRKSGPGIWLVTGAITAGGIVGYVIIMLFVGRRDLSRGVFKVTIVATAYNLVIAPLVSRAVAWAAGGQRVRAYYR